MNKDFHTLKIQLAYNEGRRAYYKGTPREANNYETLGHEDRAAGWWLGWDLAKTEDEGAANPANPRQDEP